MTGHISTKYGLTSKVCTSWCSTKEANDSLVTPTKEEEKSTSTPSAPAVDPPSSRVPEGATARNGHAHWLYFRVDEARAKMEHTLSTLELSIQIYQAIKIIRDNESGKLLYRYCLKQLKGGERGILALYQSWQRKRMYWGMMKCSRKQLFATRFDWIKMHKK